MRFFKRIWRCERKTDLDAGLGFFLSNKNSGLNNDRSCELDMGASTGKLVGLVSPDAIAKSIQYDIAQKLSFPIDSSWKPTYCVLLYLSMAKAPAV